MPGRTLPGWLQERSGRKPTPTPTPTTRIPFTPAPAGIPSWLSKLTMQPAQTVTSFPERTHTATATDQPTVRELNEAYWRERQRAERLRSYGIEAQPIQERQTRVEIPDWLKGILPEGFSEKFIQAATGAPITFTGGGPVVGQVPTGEGMDVETQRKRAAMLASYGITAPEITGEEPEPEKKPELTRVPLTPFWEEKMADLLRSLETTETPTTWYDTGGGGWFPSYGGGGGYTPSKAASRWWMNLARWNI